MNDIAIARSELERIDWSNVAHLVRTQGACTVSYEPNIKQLTYEVEDRKHHVMQVFIVTLTETPIAEGPKEAVQIVP
jgi:hypothetical protein